MARGHKSDEQTADILERRAQALALRRSGLGYRPIGEILGVSRQTAHNDVTKALEELAKEVADGAEQLRALEGSRLETALHKVMTELNRPPDPERGAVFNPKAIELLIKVSESYRKLYGLDAPQRVDATLTMKPEEAGERIRAVLGLTAPTPTE